MCFGGIHVEISCNDSWSSLGQGSLHGHLKKILIRLLLEKLPIIPTRMKVKRDGKDLDVVDPRNDLQIAGGLPFLRIKNFSAKPGLRN